MSKSKHNKRNSEHFVPNHYGTQPGHQMSNKQKQMGDTSGEHAQVIQTKGE